MKSISKLYALAIFSFACIISLNGNAQKTYISLENGLFFGSPSKQIGNAFKSNGFGDTHYWNFNFFGLEADGHNSYPKSTGNSVSILNRIRVGHTLNTNSALEISFTLPRKSRAEGYDASFSNFITFENKVTDFSALYMWHNKNKTLGIGVGPAISFYKLDIKGETETEFGVLYIEGTSREDTYTLNRNYMQAGIATSAFWRIINKPVFFMDLRSDFTFLSAVKTPAINDTKTNAEFPSIKLNSFCADLNIAFGVKF
jgi:hypothetical protein